MSRDQRPAQTRLRVVSPAPTPAAAGAAGAAAAAATAVAAPARRAMPFAFVIGALLGGAGASVGVRAAGVDIVALLTPPAEAAPAAPAGPDNFDPR